MKQLKFSFFIFIIISFQLVSAQDTLQLMNGKQKVAHVISVDTSFVKFSQSEADINKAQTIETSEVFAINYLSGKKNILYEKDTAKGNDFTVDEMRFYILGEKDAHKIYKTGVILPSVGFVVGAAAGFAGFYGLPIVPIYSILLGVIDPNLNPRKVSDVNLIPNKFYTKGYYTVSTKKRVIIGALSSLIGFIATTAVIATTPSLQN